MCGCEAGLCAGPGQQEDSSACTKKDPRATRVCGSCQCVELTGPTCQCAVGEGGGLEILCRAESDDRECSGHGECDSCNGLCSCYEGWVGKHCECSTQNQHCGGLHTCNNGSLSCECREGWTNEPACDCSTATENCRPGREEEGRACSGRGECRCNQCECQAGFSGKFCQVETSNVHSQTCERMSPCVLHKIYGSNESIPADKRQVTTSVLPLPSLYLAGVAREL